jgi:hypothetical protein
MITWRFNPIRGLSVVSYLQSHAATINFKERGRECRRHGGRASPFYFPTELKKKPDDEEGE